MVASNSTAIRLPVVLMSTSRILPALLSKKCWWISSIRPIKVADPEASKAFDHKRLIGKTRKIIPARHPYATKCPIFWVGR